MATSEKVPPIVDFKINNPVTYIKIWWEKIMGKEGIDLSFRIHPITAILIAAVIATIGFGAGRITIPESMEIPFFEFGYNDLKTSPSPEPTWKVTAFSGKLQYSITTSKFFLLTTSSEAITLDVPTNLNLIELVGKRIMAVGEYNKNQKLLKIIDAKDLEVLPKSPVPIPTVNPTNSPVPSPIPTNTTFETNQNTSSQEGNLNQ